MSDKKNLMLDDLFVQPVKDDNGTIDSKSKVHKKNRLNDLSGKDWIQETKSFFFQKGLGANSPEAKYEKLHPAPFSFTDVSKLLRFFTKRGSKVLDPFLGVGSTIKACIEMGRKGFGIELNEKWCEITKIRLKEECNYIIENKHLICDDSHNILNYFEPNSFDFIITSPPYWNILNKNKDYKAKERSNNGYDINYSNGNKHDLGNIESYAEFLDEIADIFLKCYEVLKHGKYMCVVVSDFRHKSEFVPYHADLIYKLTYPASRRDQKRFSLQGIKILVQNAKKLYPYGYPYAYVENIHHQYILVFKK
jgi:DNA modification methylase